ncbi:LamG-like jellyroll fold domain-containing protein [Kitasatospora purpeofusca]|uniref:LamG-like jellyroll fold domain-containing protein n=1 Tax=Kitasatospora purpeofusca TaxID=67352 RepID=UPI0036882FC2
MPLAPPGARLGVLQRTRIRSRWLTAAATGLALVLAPTAPAAFAASAAPAGAPTTSAIPPNLARTIADADARRAKEKPLITAADRAMAQAKATGRRVPVPELTDEFSETAATPDGHLARTQHPEQQRVKQAGNWAPLDARLVADPAGGFRPAAAASGVHLSGGGVGPLGTLTGPDGETLAIDSPFPLTKPVLDEDGDGLVYPEVASGIDLKVTANKFGGLNTVLIVKTAEAARNPQLAKVRFGTTTKDITVTTDQAGNLSAAGKDGVVRWHAPVPQMWDSSSSATAATASATAPAKPAQPAPAGKSADAPGAAGVEEPPAPAPVSNADGPAPGAKVASMATLVSGGAIELTTDRSILENGQGPWFIDPGWIYDRREGNAWTWTQQAFNTPRYGQTTASGDKYARPGVGYQGFDSPKGIERSFYQFDTRGYAGTVVTKATMAVWEDQSSDHSCTTSYLVDLYQTGPINTSTVWSNEPGIIGTRVGEAKVAGSGDAQCRDNVRFDYDVTSVFQNYAPAHDTVTFGLRARNEADRMAFKRLDYRPVIEVYYDRAPEAPSDPYISPAPATAVPRANNQGCDGSSLGWLSAGSDFNGAVTLNATVHSPVQSTLYSWSHIWDYSLPNAPDVDSGFSGEVVNGSNAAFNVRGDVIKDGHVYGWSAHSTDQLIDASGPTPTCRFGVDLTPPTLSVKGVYDTLPEAELADRFPPSGNGQVTKKRSGEWGIIPFSAVDTAPDGGTPSGVVCARFSWDPQFSNSSWQCGSDMPQDGVHVLPGRWGTNIGYIQVMDNARNVSAVAQYAFYVPWNPDGPPPVFGDVTGDSAPDIVTTDRAGNLRAYTVPGNPLAKSPAISLVAKPADSPTGDGWLTTQFAHRGTFTGGNNIDDVVAHAPGDKYLRLYGNPGNTGYYGRIDSKTTLDKPKCVVTTTEDCSWLTTPGYNAADWSNTLRIASLGDPVNTDLDYKLQFKNRSGLLTVESTDNGADAALWYYPATAGNILGKPVRLAASGWRDKELLAPGDWAKQGHPGLWTRNLENGADGEKGTLHGYIFGAGTVTATDKSGRPIVDANNQPRTVPTLTWISGPLHLGEVSVDRWPVLGSDGDLTGNGSPTLWGKNTDGQIDIWWGETTDPGGANPGMAWHEGPQTIADTSVNPLWWGLGASGDLDSSASDPLYPNAFTRTTDHNGAGDKATAFDGWSTFYRSTGQPGIDTSQSFTVAAWVKLDNTNGYRTAVSQTGQERSPFYLQYAANLNRWAFTLPGQDYRDTDTYFTAADDRAPETGVWTHLVGTYNAPSRTATLYVNGRTTGSAWVGGSWRATGSLDIGGAVTDRYGTPEDLFSGAISDVRVYPYTFTEQQANALATTNSRVRIHSSYDSGKCLDDWGGGVGTLVAVYNCWNGDSQHLSLTTDNKIKVRGSSDRCLGIADTPARWGSKIQIQSCNGADPGQNWVRRFDGTLYNPAADSCLELPGWSTENGTTVGIWQCNGNANQRWFAEAQTN